MMLKFLAWLFNWELVMLIDFDGETCTRRVITKYGKRVAYLLPEGQIGFVRTPSHLSTYVHTWKTIRKKRGRKYET